MRWLEDDIEVNTYDDGFSLPIIVWESFKVIAAIHCNDGSADTQSIKLFFPD